MRPFLLLSAATLSAQTPVFINEIHYDNVATDVGVYRTTNLGKTWLKVGDNLPLVPINDIDLPAGSQTLYAATYGRSIWTTSLADAG